MYKLRLGSSFRVGVMAAACTRFVHHCVLWCRTMCTSLCTRVALMGEALIGRLTEKSEANSERSDEVHACTQHILDHAPTSDHIRHAKNKHTHIHTHKICQNKGTQRCIHMCARTHVTQPQIPEAGSLSRCMFSTLTHIFNSLAGSS